MYKIASRFALTGMILLGTSASVVLAQASAPPSSDATPPPPPPGMHGHRIPPDPSRQLARMTTKLNLSADQQAQIKPILVDRNQQFQALQADTALSRPDKMAKFKSIHEDTDAKIEGVLNDQQKQQWAQLKQQEREKMQERMQNHKGGPGGEGPPVPPPAGL